MPIMLTPETEAQLTVIAAQRGLPPEKALIQVVDAEAQRVAEESDTADAVAGLLRGSAEIASGDWVSLEDLRHNLSEQSRKRRQPEPLTASASEGSHATR